MKYRVFLVDDDRQYARLISYRLENNHDNCSVSVFHTGEDALEHIDENPDLVLLDVMMPGIGGLETLKRIKKSYPTLPVVMVSAQGVISVAIDAMKTGAYDYVTKGQDDLVKLDRVFEHVTKMISLSREVETLRSEVAQRYGMSELVGDHPSMEEVYRLIQKTLRGDLAVAIQGESGTGKELVARAIHYNSPRRRGPFVVVNCAAIPSELMESEFFGHEKGSFTGAHARKIGKFEQAHGGTLFLDEISELDLGLQAKLLRALQNREITRVGGNHTIGFDARIISATNRDIREMIRVRRFREDLYYRLFDFPISLPPLRERGQDAILLAQHFFRSYIEQHPEFASKRLSADTKRVILEYTWPGNVRELKSAIERAILLADEDEITPEHLMLNLSPRIDPWLERQQGESTVATGPAAPEYFSEEADLVDATEVRTGNIVPLEDLKRQAVETAYRLCNGNVDEASVKLGIGRATLYRLLKKYELTD